MYWAALAFRRLGSLEGSMHVGFMGMEVASLLERAALSLLPERKLD